MAFFYQYLIAILLTLVVYFQKAEFILMWSCWIVALGAMLYCSVFRMTFNVDLVVVIVSILRNLILRLPIVLSSLYLVFGTAFLKRSVAIFASDTAITIFGIFFDEKKNAPA